jgi:DNA-binding transcriptional LysR family regulator
VQQQWANLTFAQQETSRYGVLAHHGWGTVATSQQWSSQQRVAEASVTSAQQAQVPCLGFGADDAPDVWRLMGADGREAAVRIAPRLTCGELFVLRAAAVAGLGVALIPDHFCQEQLLDGRLLRLLPDWCKQPGLIHAVFTTKRGLTPAVRALIDHLSIGFKQDSALEQPSAFSARTAVPRETAQA